MEINPEIPNRWIPRPTTIFTNERGGRESGDTERCSPFAARGEATHVARRSFVIRQIAFLPAVLHEKSQVRVSTQRGRTRTRLGRRRIRARKIIIILTGRAGAAIFLASKNRNTYLSFLPINSAAAFEDRASKSLIPEIQKS